MGHVESHFDLVGDSVASVQDRCSVCVKCTIGSEIILDTPDGVPRCKLKCKLDSVRLEIVQILTQHRCTVCDE
jgi:hypothetical protein